MMQRIKSINTCLYLGNACSDDTQIRGGDIGCAGVLKPPHFDIGGGRGA